MRKVTIVGGGQAGMQLGIGLRQKGYEVRVVSNRTPDDIRTGKVLSSQCMFDDALQSERDLGINVWERECPKVDGIGVILPAPDGSGKAGLGLQARQTGSSGRSARQDSGLDEPLRDDWR
jgi:nucleoside-diphosphate-sugar epimerase